MTILFVLLIQAAVVADQQPIEEFANRFDSLKAKVTADFAKEIEHFRKLDRSDYSIALCNAVIKHRDELQSLVTTALSFPSLWGTDENGHKQPFALIAEPIFIMKDEKLNLVVSILSVIVGAVFIIFCWSSADMTMKVFGAIMTAKGLTDLIILLRNRQFVFSIKDTLRQIKEQGKEEEEIKEESNKE